MTGKYKLKANYSFSMESLPNKKLGVVLASKYRKEIVKLLSKGGDTPKGIADQLNFSLSNVSRTLSELREIGVVECTTPKLRKGRIYRLTETGEKIVSSLTSK